MTLSSRLGLGLLTLSTLAATACGASDEKLGAAENDVRVTPKGTNDPPSITYKLPAGLTPADVAANARYIIDNRTVALDVETTVTVGSHTLQVGTNDNDVSGGRFSWEAQTISTLATSLGNGYTVDLTAIAMAEGFEPVLAKQFEAQSKLGAAVFPITYRKALVFLPEHMNVRFGIMDGFQVDGRPGTKTNLSLTDYGQRQAVRVRAPIRELPSSCGNISAGKPYFAVGAQRYTGTEPLGAQPRTDTASLEDGKSIVIGYNPSVWRAGYDASATPANGTVAYVLSVNGTSVMLPLSAVGAPPRDLTLGRIDVEHVEVTNADGTKSRVPGTFAIYSAKPNGDFEPSPRTSGCATSSGLDVVAGKYRVVVDYVVPEGRKQAINVVDVP